MQPTAVSGALPASVCACGRQDVVREKPCSSTLCDRWTPPAAGSVSLRQLRCETAGASEVHQTAS